MTTLREFRNSRTSFNAQSPKGRTLIQNVSDLELEPDARLVHQYQLDGYIGIIIERAPRGKGNEYVWLWCHPCESIELTRERAEAELFAFIFGGEDSDMIDGEPDFSAEAEAAHERRQLGSNGN